MIIPYIKKMITKPQEGIGVDIIIISTNTLQQEIFWQNRLEMTKGVITKKDATIICVNEEWKGGAGNGLGTLYAFKKAQEKAKKTLNRDILEELNNGASIALYHTAGKGTRLAPLTISEYNNKSAVKLPQRLKLKDSFCWLTLLEAVIRQTGAFSHSNKGRLSVFWGDQIFIPSSTAMPTAPLTSSPVSILCQYHFTPEKEEWEKNNWDKYGLLAFDENKKVKQIEKITYAQYLSLIENNTIKKSDTIGKSLGSFSLSATFTKALLEEFSDELTKEIGKFDSDPHFWMPLTLDLPVYMTMMEKRGTPTKEIKEHYKRKQQFAAKYKKEHNYDESSSLIDIYDIGKDSYWWDFGTIQYYYTNLMKLLDATQEGDVLRHLFEVPANSLDSKNNSCLIDCSLKSKAVTNSVLFGVKADQINVSDSVIVDSQAESIKGDFCLAYKVNENAIHLDNNSVQSDIIFPSSKIKERACTQINRENSKDWDKVILSNSQSFEDLHLKMEKALSKK